MTLSLPNGEIRYTFDDLSERYGYYVARQVFEDIDCLCDRYIDIYTGEVTHGAPTQPDEGALFDEVGWLDLCSQADEIAAQDNSISRMGHKLNRIRQLQHYYRAR